MITIDQGTPGSGKSAVATALALRHIKRGGVVAANFQLVEGWADVLAMQHPLSRLSDAFRYSKASSYYQRFLYVDSLAAIRSIDPRALSVDLYKNDGKYSEGNGLLLIDEAQLVFNTRKWGNNFEWITFFTQHRKLGWDCNLIAHSIEMIDSQIRPLAEYASTFRNLQKVRVPVLGFPLVPYPTFMIIKRYAGLGAGSSHIHSRDVVGLPIWAAQLYDSLLVFDESKWTTEETLPQCCGYPPQPNTKTGLLDEIKKWWDALGEKKRLSSPSRDCLWSQYEQKHAEDYVLQLQEKDIYTNTWPSSLKGVSM